MYSQLISRSARTQVRGHACPEAAQHAGGCSGVSTALEFPAGPLPSKLSAYMLPRPPKQAMMNRLLQPPEFLLAEQYASAVTTLGLALCWMPVLPASPMIAALGLFLGYWAEKVVALR